MRPAARKKEFLRNVWVYAESKCMKDPQFNVEAF
jgi:hypothetical protein